jgi:hypothetical protein
MNWGSWFDINPLSGQGNIQMINTQRTGDTYAYNQLKVAIKLKEATIKHKIRALAVAKKQLSRLEKKLNR